MIGQEQGKKGVAHRRAAPNHDALDVTALRRALHGWWLGNPLLYMPALDSAGACARELARTDGTPGTTLVTDQCSENGEDIRRIGLSLILPAGLPVAALTEAASAAAEEAVEAVQQRQQGVGATFRTWLAPVTGCHLLCATLEMETPGGTLWRARGAHGTGGSGTSGGWREPGAAEALLATLLHRLDLRCGALRAGR